MDTLNGAIELFLAHCADHRKLSPPSGRCCVRRANCFRPRQIQPDIRFGTLRSLNCCAQQEGVYLPDSIEGAAQWKTVTIQEKVVAVIEVEIDRRTIRDGVDHSPLMQTKFGAGKSFLSPKSIPGKSVKQIHFYTIGKGAKSQVATRKNCSV
jgi:hypothetical protein